MTSRLEAAQSRSIVSAMDRKRPDQGWRAAAFAAALFAITLNFLQPLAHAATLRDGGPQAAAALWGAFCLTTTQEYGTPGPVPGASKIHECCLGLAHAPVLAEPSSGFVAVDAVVADCLFAEDLHVRTRVGIRDGPHGPRAPPSHA